MTRAPDDTEHGQTNLAPTSSADGNGDDQRSVAEGNGGDQRPVADGNGDDQRSVANDKTAQAEVKEYEDFRVTGFANKHELSW